MANSPTNVLIVGGSGFIGGQLLRRFAAQGCNVETWSRSPVVAPPHTTGGFTHRIVDLLDPKALPAAPDGGWDVVFQFAGESRPSRFVGNEHLRNTVVIADRVVQHVAAVSYGAHYFLNSSAYVYPSSAGPCCESSPAEPSGPYGLAKLLAEDVTLLQREKLRITIIRPFNLVGPHMPGGLFATDLLARLQSAEGPVVLPVADTCRDLLDIRDAVDAYLALLANPTESGSVFNLCSGRATRTSEFAAALLGALGVEREVQFTGDPGPPMIGANDKLRTLTDWQPGRSLLELAQSLVGSLTQT